VNPEPLWATGRDNRPPPANINRAKPVKRMVVVPKMGRFLLGGSTSSTVGESSRRLLSLMMLSVYLRRPLKAILNAYGPVARRLNEKNNQHVSKEKTGEQRWRGL
jgi:hypothetical protein